MQIAPSSIDMSLRCSGSVLEGLQSSHTAIDILGIAKKKEVNIGVKNIVGAKLDGHKVVDLSRPIGRVAEILFLS